MVPLGGMKTLEKPVILSMLINDSSSLAVVSFETLTVALSFRQACRCLQKSLSCAKSFTESPILAPAKDLGLQICTKVAAWLGSVKR